MAFTFLFNGFQSLPSGGGSSGGGTITSIASPNGSIVITNPNGPNVLMDLNIDGSFDQLDVDTITAAHFNGGGYLGDGSGLSGVVTNFIFVPSEGITATVLDPTSTPVLSPTLARASDTQYGIVKPNGTSLDVTVGGDFYIRSLDYSLSDIDIIVKGENNWIGVGSVIGFIYSENKGINWIPSTGTPGTDIACMASNSNGVIVAGTSFAGIVCSSDDGESFALTVNDFDSISGICATNVGFIASTLGDSFWYCGPTGLDWDVSTSYPGINATCIAFGANVNICVGGAQNNGLYRSTDGGVTYTKSVSFPTTHILDLSYNVNTGTWAAVTLLNGILYSVDDAVTWFQSSKTNGNITAITNNGTVFVAALSGGGYIYSADAITWSVASGNPTGTTTQIVDNGNGFTAATTSGIWNAGTNGQVWVESDDYNTTSIKSIGVANGVYIAGTSGSGVLYSIGGVLSIILPSGPIVVGLGGTWVPFGTTPVGSGQYGILADTEVHFIINIALGGGTLTGAIGATITTDLPIADSLGGAVVIADSNGSCSGSGRMTPGTNTIVCSDIGVASGNMIVSGWYRLG